MTNRLEAFRKYRTRMNQKISDEGNRLTKRFFAIDSRVYDDGVLSTKMKEMLGLVASTVLRCDDCISYHIARCVELGVTDDEFNELFNVALIVGGSIVIPHFRRAIEFLEECRNAELPIL
jgi:AhpD family alkylhydroperoxidase